MSKTYRLAVIGFAHMHINNVLALFARHPQVQLVAGADTIPARPELRKAPYTRQWNLDHAIANLGLPKKYDDYRKMLDQEDLDIAIVCSENAQHPQVVADCAARGVHACVEKPMAMNLGDALAMVQSVRAAGTTMLINWPMVWDPSARKCKELIDAGAIGRILEVRTRLGHTGPLGPGAKHAGVSDIAAPLSPEELSAAWWHSHAAGGGAMLDFCCYGAMLSRWFIGQNAVSAIGLRANLNSPWGDADDNAVMAVRFPSALAVFEGTWTTADHGIPTGPAIHGTEGTLVMDRREDGQFVHEFHGQGKTTTHDPGRLPPGRSTIAEEFIHHLDANDPVHLCLEMMFNLQAMAILDAGLRSADSGRLEAVETPALGTDGSSPSLNP
jgi:glucose-fructose oxidoreductase